jgi:hypothetical protein
MTVALFLPERCAIWMFLLENIKSVRQTSRQHCEKYVDLWLQERPQEQAPLTDERTGEKVNYLFQFRGKRGKRTPE